MNARLHHLLHILRASFWPLPTLLCLGAVGLGFGLLALDRVFEDQLADIRETSAEGLRTLLSTSATAILTLAGLVFSATLVSLTLASSQYGPRILHNFIRSRPNQITLGLLSGNFLLCLIVLRETREDFLPHLSAFAAFLGTLAGLLAFLLFVNHLVHSLRAESVIASVMRELDEALDRFFPDRSTQVDEESSAEEELESWEKLEGEDSVPASRSGYLARFEIEALVEIASEKDFRMRTLFRPGQMIYEGDPLIAIGSDTELPEETVKRLEECFVISDERTPEQDFEFSMRQLVEIAVRALSPGINDPFTAANCVDALSACLARIASRPLPKRTFRDEDGVPRLRIRPSSFRSMLECAFQRLRQDAATRIDVSLRILEGLGAIAKRACSDERRDAVAEMARRVVENVETHAHGDRDLEEVREAAELVVKQGR